MLKDGDMICRCVGRWSDHGQCALNECRRAGINCSRGKQLERLAWGNLPGLVDDPGARQGLRILEYAHIAILVDGCEALDQPLDVRRLSLRPNRNHDVTHVEQIEQWRIEASREHVGVMVILAMAVERRHELDVPLHLDGVVALDVVQPIEHGPIVDIQRPGGRVSEVVTVEDSLPILDCPNARVVSEGAEWHRRRLIIQERGGLRRGIELADIDAVEAAVGRLSDRGSARHKKVRRDHGHQQERNSPAERRHWHGDEHDQQHGHPTCRENRLCRHTGPDRPQDEGDDDRQGDGGHSPPGPFRAIEQHRHGSSRQQRRGNIGDERNTLWPVPVQLLEVR